mgnify:CR=1 FL=1
MGRTNGKWSLFWKKIFKLDWIDLAWIWILRILFSQLSTCNSRKIILFCFDWINSDACYCTAANLNIGPKKKRKALILINSGHFTQYIDVYNSPTIPSRNIPRPRYCCFHQHLTNRVEIFQFRSQHSKFLPQSIFFTFGIYNIGHLNHYDSQKAIFIQTNIKLVLFCTNEQSSSSDPHTLFLFISIHYGYFHLNRW